MCKPRKAGATFRDYGLSFPREIRYSTAQRRVARRVGVEADGKGEETALHKASTVRDSA